MRYAVHIDEKPATKVIEEDVQIAMERVGLNPRLGDVQEVDEGEHFIIETVAPLPVRAFQAALERLDGSQACKVSIEYLR